MNILITGSSGFIARHFIKRLEPEHTITRVDIKDGIDCRDFFKHDTTKYDLVIHCAAIVEGREAIDNEPIRLATNLSVDSEMFNWAVRTHQKKIVCFSSAASYPIAIQNEQRVRMAEDLVDLKNFKEADNTYGFAKLALELLAEHARKEGLEVFIVRPFSCYGEDQSDDYPFSSFIKRAKNHEDPFICWGDGEQVRDWIHNEDLVSAILALVEAKEYGPTNICTGVGYSMNETIRMICQAAGYEPTIKHLLDKPVGVLYRVGDPTKLKRFYTPKISLEEGIARCFKP